MNALSCLLYTLATLVLLAVVSRLADLQGANRNWRCRVAWNLWVLGHVSIALGAFAILAGLRDLVMPLTFAGLALTYLVRMERRSTDG